MALLLMASWTERSFDLVTEISKQLITLSTGVIALGITFSKDFVLAASQGTRHVLAWSWLAYLGAIVSAIATLMASAGVQGRAHTATPSPDPYARSIRFFAAVQLRLFVLGLVLTVLAGFQAL